MTSTISARIFSVAVSQVEATHQANLPSHIATVCVVYIYFTCANIVQHILMSIIRSLFCLVVDTHRYATQTIACLYWSNKMLENSTHIHSIRCSLRVSKFLMSKCVMSCLPYVIYEVLQLFRMHLKKGTKHDKLRKIWDLCETLVGAIFQVHFAIIPMLMLEI